ncbi:polysaccharide pyruvyl transferase family protein [Pararoseomonas indoligenes]|uniref:Polysaccharide pyruvyl transferase family protein n=1 Tax=Roseomonas indoligenes TaxID=2820811 RepID=A0A940N0M3_9PROT|nr:polysaccharide pyruvyl transferase family protein [Pararoseomonas indoligenes]MBP0495696.1 polysaccharide pyruvyl transferase family protein [Pararoseomonas indoligenes]
MTTNRVFFWLQKQPVGNFGDALTLVYLNRLFEGECRYPAHSIHLVGSVITEARLESVQKTALAAGDGNGLALYWQCGKKDGEPLPEEMLRRCRFLGVRGTLSRDALGLPRSTPLGDSAFLLPRMYQPKNDPAVAGKVLWVPHFHHQDPSGQDLDKCPDYVVKRPAIPNDAASCEAFIDAIVSARFVMANAMHAAVTALAYGIPFAFWSGSGINVPFKWRDLTSAFGIELAFHQSFLAASEAYDRSRPDKAFAEMDLDPLLRVAPYALRSGHSVA